MKTHSHIPYLLILCFALLGGVRATGGEDVLWTLADCQAEALRHSADLNAAAARLDAARALALQAGRRRNPEASATVLGAERSVGIAQEFDVWGKRSAAVGLAEADTAVSDAQRGVIERRLMEDVARHYWHLARSETLVALLVEESETWQRLLDIRRQETELGAFAPTELLSIEERVGDREQILLRTRHERNTARAALNALMARRPDAPLRLAASLSDTPSFPVEEILAAATATDPAAGEARASAVSAGYRIVREQREWRPNPQFGPAAKEEDGQWAAGVRLIFSIPVWDRNRGGIRAAEANRDQAAADVEGAERLAVRTAYRRLLDHAMLTEALTHHETKIVPLIEQRLNRAERAVETGDGSLLDALTARLAWLRRRQEAETLRYHRAEAASLIEITMRAATLPSEQRKCVNGKR